MATKVDAPTPEVATFLIGEAEVQRDLRDLARAEGLYREGLSMLERAVSGKSIAHAEALADLAGVLGQEQQFDEAARLYQKALDALATTSYLAGNVELRVSSPNYAALTEPQPLAAAEIQGLLGANTLLLEYSLGDEHSYVWALTGSSLAVYELPRQATIEALAHRLYHLLTLRNRMTGAGAEKAPGRAGRGYEKAARKLSQVVIGPVEHLLEEKRLLIVADGALQYIPFSALPDTKRLTTPLVLKHEIVNLPSASILAEIRRQAIGRKMARMTVAVLADPGFDSEDERVTSRTRASTTKPDHSLPGDLRRSAADLGLSRNGKVHLARLLYTRKEANAIVAVTPAGKAFEAVDFRASQTMATSPVLAKYRVVHFATHGLLNSKHPQLSGLVFSMVDERGRPQDGFLRLQDNYNLNLPVD